MQMAIGVLNSIVSIEINTPPLLRGSTGDLSVGDGCGYDSLDLTTFSRLGSCPLVLINYYGSAKS